MKNNFRQNGVTILEMAISITIIALLAASVTAGMALKDQLALNQVIEDISNFNTALQEFEETYEGLPGDLWNAEERFGEANVGNMIVDGLSDGNGNGDKELDTGSPDETLLFWQHLAVAGLIDGTYDGVTDGVGGRPAGSMKNSIYRATTINIGTVATQGDLHIVLSKLNDEGLLSTKQAFDFDTKYDDGDPETGIIRAEDGSNETAEDCVTGSSPNLNYNLSNNGSDEFPCILHFYPS